MTYAYPCIVSQNMMFLQALCRIRGKIHAAVMKKDRTRYGTCDPEGNSWVEYGNILGMVPLLLFGKCCFSAPLGLSGNCWFRLLF